MVFTNIQICNISDKLSYDEIEERIIKFKENSGYKLCSEEDVEKNSNVIKILTSANTKFITVFDNEYSFQNVKENKSYIRKFSKSLTLPVFSITCIDNAHVVIEQYNFNKRIYDYISIGSLHEKVKELGFNENEYFNNIEIWKEYFVGRNNLDRLNEVINLSKNYSDKSYIVEEMFKLYGVSSDMSLYNSDAKINDVAKILYFTKI